MRSARIARGLARFSPVAPCVHRPRLTIFSVNALRPLASDPCRARADQIPHDAVTIPHDAVTASGHSSDWT